MIDVVLYGYDGRGYLTLKEIEFPNLLNLASYICSQDGFQWRWAEIELTASDGRRNFVQYTADALREMLAGSSQNPNTK